MLFVLEPERPKPAKATSSLAWIPPPRDQVALSVDGAFLESDGMVAAGMIV